MLVILRHSWMAAAPLVSVLALLPALPAAQVCVNPHGPVEFELVGDLTDNGVVNVQDKQCALLVSTWLAGPIGAPRPPCLVGPFQSVDVNCSGSVNAADVQLFVHLAFGWAWPIAVDTDGDRCANACANCPDSLPFTCLAGTLCVPDQDLHPADSCRRCEAAQPLAAFQTLADGSSCAPDLYCLGGLCLPSPPPQAEGTFGADLNVEPGSYQTSEPLTLTGFYGSALLSVQGGPATIEVLGPSGFVAGSSVVAGDVIRLRAQAPNELGESLSASVVAPGFQSDVYSVQSWSFSTGTTLTWSPCAGPCSSSGTQTTATWDCNRSDGTTGHGQSNCASPNATQSCSTEPCPPPTSTGSFGSDLDVAPASQQTSEPITMTGFPGTVALTVSGDSATIQVNSGSGWSNGNVVAAGHQVRLVMTSAGGLNQTLQARVTAPDYQSPWYTVRTWFFTTGNTTSWTSCSGPCSSTSGTQTTATWNCNRSDGSTGHAQSNCASPSASQACTTEPCPPPTSTGSFGSDLDVAPSSQQTSDAITMTGFPGTVALTVNGDSATIQVNSGGGWSNGNVVAAGHQVRLVMTAGSGLNQTREARVTAPGYQSPWFTVRTWFFTTGNTTSWTSCSGPCSSTSGSRSTATWDCNRSDGTTGHAQSNCSSPNATQSCSTPSCFTSNPPSFPSNGGTTPTMQFGSTSFTIQCSADGGAFNNLTLTVPGTETVEVSLLTPSTGRTGRAMVFFGSSSSGIVVSNFQAGTANNSFKNHMCFVPSNPSTCGLVTFNGNSVQNCGSPISCRIQRNDGTTWWYVADTQRFDAYMTSSAFRSSRESDHACFNSTQWAQQRTQFGTHGVPCYAWQSGCPWN